MKTKIEVSEENTPVCQSNSVIIPETLKGTDSILEVSLNQRFSSPHPQVAETKDSTPKQQLLTTEENSVSKIEVFKEELKEDNNVMRYHLIEKENDVDLLMNAIDLSLSSKNFDLFFSPFSQLTILLSLPESWEPENPNFLNMEGKLDEAQLYLCTIENSLKYSRDYESDEQVKKSYSDLIDLFFPTEEMLLDKLREIKEPWKEEKVTNDFISLVNYHLPLYSFTTNVCQQIFIKLNLKINEEFLQFLDSQNEYQRRFITKLLFDGFSSSDLRVDSAELTLAQIAARKAYYLPEGFKPTLLQSMEEYKAYVEILKMTAPPFRERFMFFNGSHWLAGEVCKTKTGTVRILELDSLGIPSRGIFPGIIIYVPFRRQKDGSSCGKFALDDLQHLYTIEQYLPPQFSDSGLWGYIDSTAKIDDSNSIARFDLPLSMCRSSQRYNTLKKTFTERSPLEQNTPLNKKKLSMNLEYINSIFHRVQYETGVIAYHNDYLKNKNIKRWKRNVAYLEKISDFQDLRVSMNQFTFEAFKKRKQLEVKAEPAVHIHLSDPSASSANTLEKKPLAAEVRFFITPNSEHKDTAPQRPKKAAEPANIIEDTISDSSGIYPSSVMGSSTTN